MLKLLSQDNAGDTTFWEDDVDPFQIYALPQRPSMSLGTDGKPIFKYIKYRFPIERPGGVKGGGLMVMQVELKPSAQEEAEIRNRMNDRLRARGFSSAQAGNIRIGRPTIIRGKVNVQVVGEGALVQKVLVPSPPSLYGNNAVSIGAELNEFGAPVFEAALKSPGASLVLIGYEFGYYAKLPNAMIIGRWNASAFMHFAQTVKSDERMYGDDDYSEKVSEFLHKSESQTLEWVTPLLPTPGVDPATVAKAKQNIEDSVRHQLDEAIKRNLLEAIPPESRDVSKLRDQGYDNIKRQIDVSRTADVSVIYKDSTVVEMPQYPNGPLPAFGSMTIDGKPAKWDDYAITVDADDPFFKSFALVFMVNADFDDLPIASVILQASYKGPQGQGRSVTYTFRKPDDIQRFEAFLDGGTGEVDYSYVVNYKGESNTYKSPALKTKSDVSINVGDLGIWKVDIDVGDMNFEEVSQAQLRLWYQDGDVHREKQFTITADARKGQVREVIFKPRSNPWKYQIKYFLKSGREILGPEETADGDQLYVNDPFSAMRTVSIRTKGDFDNTIDTLFLDFQYEDPEHDYRQSQSFAFSKAGKRFEDWSFPVMSEKVGTLTYTGNLVYKDGRPPLVIPQKTVTGNTVLEGEDVLKLGVQIVPDLLDWSLLKLVTVGLSYADDANGVTASKTFTLRKDGPPAEWQVDIKDKARKTYHVAAHFFMADGSKKEPTPFDTSDDTLVLEMPA